MFKTVVLKNSFSYTILIYRKLGAMLYSCNMGTSDLPEMYAQSPRVAARGQIMSAHVTANM